MSLLYCATSFRASSLMSRNIIFFPCVSLFYLLFSQKKLQSWYFYTCMGPRNRFQGMNSASLCSLAGRYDNPLLPSPHSLFKNSSSDPCLSNPRLFFALVFPRFPPNQTTEKELGAIVAKDFSIAILFVT
jgi:hypothetical protein